ncbi:MAG: NAD-dependent succinate-semialdehyde dehydrogenase [Bacteroidia bacterium]|nr:NAD-dependent succinate-semialdehyde dehydrogenase [Bacteroidia bacterium]
MNYASINPYTEEELSCYDLISDDELEQKLSQAATSQKSWKQLAIIERVKIIAKLGELLKSNHEKLALLASVEMGKPIAEARLEVLKCARACEYYAINAENFLQPIESISDIGKKVVMQYEALGVVLGVFPWNFPYWQIIRSAVPITLAGNSILVKPAPNVPQCSLTLQQLIDDAGFPKGVIEIIFADEKQVATLLADDRIHAATLTGSEKAGSSVASQAAKHIKKSVLELGGSDPFIVMADADFEYTLDKAIVARFQNNGQSCIAAKRFIVDKKIIETFLAGLKIRMNKLECGNPIEDNTTVGPLARIDLLQKLTNQVNDSVKSGAKIYYQQTKMPFKGYFYPPTLLVDIPKDCVAYREELFGPVVSVYSYQSIEEAITIANDTEFGLGASIWSTDVNAASLVASKIECGQVFINDIVKSQLGYPFGGTKKSGFGRELGENGMYEFCNLKTIWI